MIDTIKLPTVAEELKAFNPGVVIIGAYYALEFGSLQGLYPLLSTLMLPTITAMAALGYSLWLLFTGRVRMDGFTVCYSLFILYLIANTSLLTIAPQNKEAAMKLYILYLSYFVIGSTVIRRLDSFILLLDMLLAFMAYTCLHGMLQGGLLWGSQWVSDENIYAVFCCTGIPFAYVLFLQYSSKKKKICYAICLFLFIVGVGMAASRGGFLSFIIIIFVFWLHSKKKLKGLLLLFLICLVGVMAMPPNIMDEFEQISVDEQEGDAGEREYLWKLASDMYFDHKIFGVGMMNYGEYYYEYDQMSEARDVLGGVNWRGQKMVAHSTPMTFLAETGAIGVVLLIMLLVGFFHKLIAVVKNTPNQLHRLLGLATITAMSSFWVGSLFLSLTIYPFFYNLVLIGVLVRRVVIHF